jgi:hypothetical protein
LIANDKSDEAAQFLNKTVELSYGDDSRRELMAMAKNKLDQLR